MHQLTELGIQHSLSEETSLTERIISSRLHYREEILLHLSHLEISYQLNANITSGKYQETLKIKRKRFRNKRYN